MHGVQRAWVLGCSAQWNSVEGIDLRLHAINACCQWLIITIVRSGPSEWLFLHNGVSYYHHPCIPGTEVGEQESAAENNPTPLSGQRCARGAQIFLVGNVVGWWLASACVGVYFLLDIVYSMRRQRGCVGSCVGLVIYKKYTYVLCLSHWIMFWNLHIRVVLSCVFIAHTS